MRRKALLIGGAVIGALALAWFVAASAMRRQRFESAAPPWLDPHQPPRGVAAPLTAPQQYAANHATSLCSSCTGHTAGRRLRRTYAPTLGLDPNSFVAAGFDVYGGAS